MKKRLNRIFSLLTLLVTIFIICYVSYTCKMITNFETSYELLEKSSYKSKNGTMLVFSDEKVWYFTADKTYLCVKESYENSELHISSEGQTFIFKVLNEKTIYDKQTKEFLKRGDSS